MKKVCILALLPALLGLTGCQQINGALQSANDSMKQLNTALEPAATEASPAEICSDFKNNEIAANKKWTGKYVVLQGNVSIISDANSVVYGTPASIHIAFNRKDSAAFSLKASETERAAQIKKGQPLKLKGQIRSYSYTMGCLIHLDNGTIQ